MDYFVIRELGNNNLTKTDKGLLIPSSQILPNFGSSLNIPLQYLVEPFPSKDSEFN
jgi:hypothetical protein